MRFDYTHGGKARYKVIVHHELVTDHCYFSGLEEAKQYCDRLEETAKQGTRFSLWDMRTDRILGARHK